MVTLVCGPPCAGKTTYAQVKAQPTDLVLDLDVIARALGSPRQWRHDEQYLAEAEHHMHRGMHRLAHRQGDIIAWVIRCLPNPHQRRQLAEYIKADHVLVLKPTMSEAIRRARADRRPRGTELTIRSWYYHYRPREGDEVLATAGGFS